MSNLILFFASLLISLYMADAYISKNNLISPNNEARLIEKERYEQEDIKYINKAKKIYIYLISTQIGHKDIYKNIKSYQ